MLGVADTVVLAGVAVIKSPVAVTVSEMVVVAQSPIKMGVSKMLVALKNVGCSWKLQLVMWP